MSLPRETPISSCATFIGRVGALAVALGIGAAIATHPGIGRADTDDTGSSTGPAAHSDPAGASGSPSASTPAAPKDSSRAAHDRSESNPAEKSSKESAVNVGDGREPATKDDDTTATGPDPDEADPAPPTAVTSEPGPTAARPQPENARRAAAPAERTSAVATFGDARVTQERRAAQDVPADRSSAAAPAAAPAATAVAALRAMPTIEPAAAGAVPAGGPVQLVTGLVSGFLTAMGLDPRATSGAPATPLQGPTLGAVLGWVRREIGHVVNPATSTAAAATATSLVQSTPAITATSPLGTQQQLDAERLAARTAASLPVALMKLVLQLGFRSAAQQQFALVGGPDQGNLDQLAAAVDEYAMGAAFQQQILNSNDPTVVMQVAPPHTWYGQAVPGSRILYDNPDTIYRFMGVNAASSYVIRGRFTGDLPADTTFSVLTGLSGNTAAVLGGRDLVIDPDGSFTITVSCDAATPGQTNHLQLTNDSTLIATRNTLSDWGTEVPMTLSIERVAGPPNSLFSQLGGFAIPGLGPLVVGNPRLTTLVSLIPPLADPPPLLRGAVAAVIMALGIQREATYMAVATTDPETGQRIPPNQLKDPTRNAEFLATQLQSAGYFQLTDQQALVVTIDPGNAGYFVLPVTNDWTISSDYWNQQTSLNISQAIANPDGTYTLVIAKIDPGVANWVSTGGLNQGTISMRFQDLDLDSTDLPTVSSQVVTLDQLAGVLPGSTVYYTSAQRAAQLSTRKAGFDNRFAPYPQP